MRSKCPNYAIVDIINAVEGGMFTPETTAKRDAINLGYDRKSIGECICCLGAGNFIKSRQKSTVADIYHINHRGPTGDINPLYIKLRLNNTYLIIESFKLQ